MIISLEVGKANTNTLTSTVLSSMIIFPLFLLILPNFDQVTFFDRFSCFTLPTSVTRLGDIDFGPLFKAFGNN